MDATAAGFDRQFGQRNSIGQGAGDAHQLAPHARHRNAGVGERLDDPQDSEIAKCQTRGHID